MKVYWLLVLIILWIILIPSPALASLDKNLKLGDSGPEVKRLQIILNKDHDTQIAINGLGSPRQETGFFGVKTEAALSKFQEKFKEVILEPLGLKKGTGRLGNLTRSVMNELYGSDLINPVLVESVNQIQSPSMFNIIVPPEPPPLQETISKPISSKMVSVSAPPIVNTNNLNNVGLIDPPRSTKVKIHSISPEGGTHGTQVKITGSGFSTSTPNVVYVSGVRKNITSSNGTTLQVVVDNPIGRTSNLPTSTVDDEDGNSFSVSGDNISISSKLAGSFSFSLSGLMSLFGKNSFDIPVAIYIVDNTGKISNEKIFKLRP